MRYEGDLEGALVQFASPTEAKKAHDSTEAVLNNRFIKVYYLRKDNNYGSPPTLKESTLEVSCRLSYNVKFQDCEEMVTLSQFVSLD